MTVFITYLNFLPYIPWFVFALLSDWIADRRFGNHTMVRVGVVVSFLASILATVLQLAAPSDGVTVFVIKLS